MGFLQIFGKALDVVSCKAMSPRIRKAIEAEVKWGDWGDSKGCQGCLIFRMELNKMC